jgi:predicted transposase/invertase (TIGR01784 family)
MLGKFLDPKNDLAFRRIFGTERNKDILIHFLNDIFARTINPIESVTFLKESQPPEIQSQRVSIVDILCEDTLHNRFIIEMQVAKETGFAKRAQYYAAKTYIEQRAKGTQYQDLKEVTLLSIANFELFPNKPTYLSHHVMLDKDSLERDLKDFSFSFLELPKFKKKFNQLITMTEKWAYFFKRAPETSEADLSKLMGDDFIIGRAYEELNRFGWTPEELREYDSVEMKRSADKAVLQAAREDGIEIGTAQGIEIGEKRNAVKIAKNMIFAEISSDKVSEFTGLSMEELSNLNTDELD